MSAPQRRRFAQTLLDPARDDLAQGRTNHHALTTSHCCVISAKKAGIATPLSADEADALYPLAVAFRYEARPA